VIRLSWAERAQDDLAAIHAFISRDSPHYASVVVRKLLAAVDRLHDFPKSGRAVPEFANPSVSEFEIHVLTVHHGARRFPKDL
jgi:toxin ParE1/3/4